MTTRTGYDGLGRTVVVTDALGFTTGTGYDRLGATRIITDAVGRVTRMGADGSGAARWTRTPDGRVSVTLVDGLGRATATIQHYQNGVVDAGEASDRDVITRTGYDAAGRVIRRTDPRGRVTALAYDLLDRLITVTEHLASGACPSPPCTVQTQYGYDRAGNRTRVIDARGLTTQTATYDAADRQLTLTDGLNRTTSFAYDRAGNRTSVTDPRGSGFNRTQTYDGLDRLTDVQTKQGSVVVARAQYTLDRLGQRVQAVETLGSSRTVAYAYDGVQRLVSARASGATTNSSSDGYDLAGNRTSLTANGATTSFTFNAANQVTNSGYAYDLAGNQTQDGSGAVASYDALGRMTARGNTTYAYNGDGTLVSQVTGGVTTHSTQDLAAPLRQVLRTVQGSTTTNYLYGTDRLASLAGTTRTWYAADALGTVRRTLTDAGLPGATLAYDPWGQVRVGTPQPFGFTGALQDGATGRVYLRARWYYAADVVSWRAVLLPTRWG